jgi:hypothetical protein
MGALSFPLNAQNVIYPNLKGWLAQQGDTIELLRIEKRSKNQIMLTGGADYRITAGDESLSRRLKKRTFLVRTPEGDLYLNCRKLRYSNKRLRFGAWYAPAVQIDKDIYFCAMPLGSVVGSQFVDNDEVKLGGKVGDAIATSSLVTKRVCYMLDCTTGKVEFVGRQKMLQVLANYPDYRAAYLKEESTEAHSTFKYLLKISKR